MNDYFDRLPERELGRRSDGELLDYIRDAHAAGAGHAVTDAFDHLVTRHRRRLAYLVDKVPADRVEDLLQEVYMAAFEAIVAGKSIDSFSAWTARVAANTVADFWRGREGRQLKVDRSAASADDDADGRRADRGEASVEGDFGAAELRQLIDQLLDERSESHRAIVLLFVIQGRKADAVSQLTGETETNVYKVAQRFRDDLNRLLHGDNEKDGN